jgi:phage protein D
VRLTIDGVPVYGAVSVRLEQQSYFRASRFSVTLAMGGQPLWQIADYAGLSRQSLTIEIENALFGFANLMTGQIDNVRFDCAAQTVTLNGRDLSARMIDAEIAETFVNQTASQIAAIIAERHGLDAELFPTAAMVGQYYELDHARSALQLHSRAGNEWDLLVWLAQSENFCVFVKGGTLYFGPLPALPPSLILQQDCIELTIDVSSTIPNVATVLSWNTRNKAAVTQSAGSGATTTTLVKPNLSTAQALNLANNHLAALSRHVTILEMRLPGELALMPAAPIYLSGTQSQLDQVYIIDEIIRELDAEHGFSELIRAYALN